MQRAGRSNTHKYWIYPLVAAFMLLVFYLDNRHGSAQAVAVLYVVPVLAMLGYGSLRSILMVGFASLALTMIAFVSGHFHDLFDDAFARCVFSLFAIVVTMLLSVRSHRITRALEKQADLLNLSRDAIFVRNMDGVIGMWNSGAEQLYGFTRAEAFGHKSTELLHTAFDGSVHAAMDTLLREGRWEGELVQRRRDGTLLTVNSRWALSRDRFGRPEAILETNTDITQRKRNETRLREQEQERQAVLNTMPALVWTCREDGMVDYANEYWLERGLSLAKPGGRLDNLVHPDDLDKWHEVWRDAIATRQMFVTECRLRVANGDYRWFLHRAVPLYDDLGEVQKWYAASIDIHDRRLAEQRALVAERELREVIDTIPAYVWHSTQGAGGLDSINTRWNDLGISLTDVREEGWRNIVHPDDQERLDRDLADAIARKGIYETVVRWQCGAGQFRWMLMRGAPMFDERGEILRWYGVMSDIDELKRAEDALQRAQSDLAHASRVATLGELVASIAHEVNQPLGAIVTNGEASLRWLNRETPELDEVRLGLNRVVSEGQRASEVVRRLLSLARKGAIQQKTSIDCRELVEESLALVQREIVRHGVRFSLGLDAPGATIEGDRVQLQQVLINLILNAVQALGGISGRSRELSVTLWQTPDQKVRIAVADNGEGISAANQDKLFTTFFSTKENGMGMGLSICRSIINAHGGSIWVDSEEGKGSVFQIVVPGVQAA